MSNRNAAGVIILGLLLVLGGCLQQAPGKESKQNPNPVDPSSTGENTTSWIKVQNPVSIRGNSFGYETTEKLAGFPQASPGKAGSNTMFTIYDLDLRAWQTGNMSLPGYMVELAATGEDDTVFAASTRVPPSGGPSVFLLDGWVDWISYSEGEWNFEEAPPRWLQRSAEGVTIFQGRPHVLMVSSTGWELWHQTASGTWESEPIPGIQPLGRFDITSNDTHLFIGAFGLDGHVTLLSRGINELLFTTTRLQGPNDPIGSLWVELTATGNQPPVMAWFHNALPANEEGPPMRTYAAHVDSSGSWQVNRIAGYLDRVIDLAMDGQAAYLLLTGEPDSEIKERFWRLHDGSWEVCASPYVTATLSHNETKAWVHYESFASPNYFAIPLDPESDSCLADGLETMPIE